MTIHHPGWWFIPKINVTYDFFGMTSHWRSFYDIDIDLLKILIVDIWSKSMGYLSRWYSNLQISVVDLWYGCFSLHISCSQKIYITKACSLLFQLGTTAGITRRARLQIELVGTTFSSTPTRECTFVATPSGDAGRWAVHPELHSTQVYRCVAGDEADDEICGYIITNTY